jgi:S1-C subfamily serine protease
MRAIVLLAQSAALDQAGTVHALGLGWTVSATPVPQHALVIFVEVEWAELNKSFPIRAELVDSDGVRVATEVPFDSPAFAAGLEREDRVLSIGGAAVTTESTVREAISRRKPGDEVPIVFERRGGERANHGHRVTDRSSRTTVRAPGSFDASPSPRSGSSGRRCME